MPFLTATYQYLPLAPLGHPGDSRPHDSPAHEAQHGQEACPVKYAPPYHPPVSPARARLVLCVLGLALLSGCSTSREAADSGDDTVVLPAGAETTGVSARNGAARNGRYVDPMVSTARGQAAARTGGQPESSGEAAAAEAANTYPDAPPSIGGLATEPTGVRAGSFSIFSSAQPQTQPQPQAPTADGGSAPTTGAAPAPQGGGGVSAARRSVFSSTAPAAAPGCGTDARGTPLSC